MAHTLLSLASLLAFAAAPMPPLEGQTVIPGDELQRVPSEDLEQALQARLLLSQGLVSLFDGRPPLYVIDGALPTHDVSGLNPYDIERVEFRTGPEAMALQGSRGAGGVIHITTRKGHSGPLKVRLSQRVGLSLLSNKLGSRTFEDVEEAVETFGERARSYYQPGQVFDHEQQLASQLGPSLESLLQLGGGSEHTRYFVSGLFKNDVGPVLSTGYGRQGVTLGLEQDVGDAVRISATAHLLHVAARREPSPYPYLAVVPGFLDLSEREDGTFPSNPFMSTGLNPLEFVARYSHEEDSWRGLGSLGVDATLWSSGPHTVTLAARGGLALSQGKTTAPVFPDSPSLTTVDTTARGLGLQGVLELRHQFHPAPGGLVLHTSAGVVLDREQLDTEVSLNPNSAPLKADSDTDGQAAFLRMSALLLDERLGLEAAVRAEQRRFSRIQPQGIQLLPSAAVSYRFQVPGGLIDEVRPRVAYTETGVLLRASGSGGADTEGLRVRQLQELELGVDVLMLAGAARLGVRGWQQQAPFESVELTSPGAAGLGVLGARGVEAALEAVPLRTGSWQWTSRTLFGLSRAWVDALNGPPFFMGDLGNAFGRLRLEEGASVTRIVGNNGLLPDGTCCRVGTVGDVTPDFRMAFQNEVRMGPLALWVLLDWRQGGDALNLIRYFQDVARTSRDYETAGQERLARQSTEVRTYLEDASFLKVREVALGYAFPEHWYRGVLPGVREVRLSGSARNVLTFTHYTGVDPEAGRLERPGLSLRFVDMAPLMPRRSFWLSLDAGF
jgi:hypothetical protein